MVELTNSFTGEVVELPTDTPEQIAEAWRMAQEAEKNAKALKDQLKPLALNLIDENTGRSEEVGKFMFKRTMSQRMTYDKSALRAVFDEDLLDTFMVVKKKAVDDWVKENAEFVDPDQRYVLKNGLIPDGAPYEVIKLERILA